MSDQFQRFHKPDETATFRGNADDGFMGSWDNVFNPEDLSDIDNYNLNERTKGGGSGGIDVLFDNPSNADPELRHLYGEFLEEKYHLKLNDTYQLGVRDKDENELKNEFSAWLNEDSDSSGVAFEYQSDVKNLEDKVTNPYYKRNAYGILESIKKGDVASVGLGFTDGDIDSMAVMTKMDHLKLIAPMWVVRQAIKGIHRKDTVNGIGIFFTSQNGGRIIDSKTSEAQISNTLSHLKIDGVKLPPDVKYFKAERISTNMKFEKASV